MTKVSERVLVITPFWHQRYSISKKFTFDGWDAQWCDSCITAVEEDFVRSLLKHMGCAEIVGQLTINNNELDVDNSIKKPT